MRTIPQHITPAEQALLEFIQDSDPVYLVHALREVHEMALYHTDIPIEGDEKLHLMHVKQLAEVLEKISS
jgi:hypothetical protein